jgi:hypothetical protein
MTQGKVRCVECGAKNTDPLADRCRLCSGLLPGAAKRRVARLQATTEGLAFSAMVETEVEVWNDIERRDDDGPRSRRPTDEGPGGDSVRRWGWRRSKGPDAN